MAEPQDVNLPRKLTAIGVLGEVGAAYTVYEKNWICEDCGNENYARRQRCFRCRGEKTVATGNLVVQGAPEQCDWREAFDPKSNHIYYYNTKTKESRWERPAEMGPAPHCTGWFGRGTAGLDNASKYREANERYLMRPARKQAEAMPTTNTRLEGAYEYNIWYDKYIGDHWSEDRGRDPAETRCNVERDSGKTKADVVAKTNRYFCIHFARGACARGKDCNYFHRIPIREDENRIGMMNDCFGRERHGTDRDDMSGTGNFNRNSRTLYVGGLKNVNDNPQKLEEELYKQFSEWGEVENINVIYRLAICFVRFRHRVGAEFAKEAMGNQSILTDEVLNIRWAFDDPNPVAKTAAERSDHDAILAMVKAKGVSTTQTEYNYPDNYQIPEPKRARYEQAALGSSDAISAYPNTDAQYEQQARLLSYADNNTNNAVVESDDDEDAANFNEKHHGVE